MVLPWAGTCSISDSKGGSKSGLVGTKGGGPTGAVNQAVSLAFTALYPAGSLKAPPEVVAGNWISVRLPSNLSPAFLALGHSSTTAIRHTGERLTVALVASVVR